MLFLAGQVADGEKAAEQIGLDRDAQRNTVAALLRDIASVKQREEAYERERSRDAERTRLSDEKAAVRGCPVVEAVPVVRGERGEEEERRRGEGRGRVCARDDRSDSV